jgi:uncharacterized membrane protein YccC
MQLTPKKSWSRQKLAVERHVAGESEAGFFTGEKRAMLLLAVKTALAAGLCYWLATLAHLQDGYWGSISAIIVLQSNVGSTVTASRERLIGTLIGAAFGAGFSLVDPSVPVIAVYWMAVILAMVTCSLLGLKNSSRLAGVTVTIILLVHRTGSNWTLPMHRVLEVLLGIVVALGFSTLVLPSRAKMRLRDGLAQEFLLLGALFATLMEEFHGRPPANSAQIGKDVADAIAANAALLDAARNEPSSGPMSTEALALLQEFGRALSDALKALELAVKGGDGNGYSTQLEPELDNLAADIGKGFQYVAGCIHRWQFNDAPTGWVLEDDIAALEEKMAAIRPTGLEFPQAEILRAYAVQLHLKQLARVLRRSRMETSGAIG